MMSPAEYRAIRQAEVEDALWRADAVCAIERLWDDPEQSEDKVAGMLGISVDELERFLAFRNVPGDAMLRLRAWTEKQDVRPVRLGYVALQVLVRRYPPQERAAAMERLHKTLEIDAVHHGVRDWGLALQPMGWRPAPGTPSLRELMTAPLESAED